MNDGTDCKNPINYHRYIEEYTCSSSQATENVLKDMRMSFPSANSSFSFYAMVFCVVRIFQHLTEFSSAKYIIFSFISIIDLAGKDRNY